MSSDNLQCWQCGAPLVDLIFPVSRREECAACRAEIHVCRMCRHFRPSHREWCAEDRAEPPASAETANFCDYFTISAGAWQDPSTADAGARQQLDALFGGEVAGTTDAAAPSDPAHALKNLFGDD